MATSDLPTFVDTGNYEYTVDLDGVVFALRFLYNSRDAHWYIDLSSEAGVPLRSGIKLTTGNPLLLGWRALTRPAGEIFMIDPSGLEREADFSAIGVDVFLTYLDESELAA